MVGEYEAILEDHILVEDAIRSYPDERFELATIEEIAERRRAILAELKMASAFKLLTKLEADLKTDYERSVAAGYSDAISQMYMAIHERRKRNVSTRNLLKSLVRHFQDDPSEFRDLCSVAAGYWDFRDWYAHGRFFQPPRDFPEPDIVAGIGMEFERDVFLRSSLPQ